MTSIFETYAAKICRQAELPPKTYDTYSLNNVIMTLPLGESHAALDGADLDKLPRLGETVGLNEHMQANFFNVLADHRRELWELTRPVLIKRQYLERLEGWRDWRTLTVYLAQEGLEPAAVFRNMPITIKTGMFETADYYASDVRVVLAKEGVFEWRG
jgi:hypothetical protein